MVENLIEATSRAMIVAKGKNPDRLIGFEHDPGEYMPLWRLNAPWVRAALDALLSSEALEIVVERELEVMTAFFYGRSGPPDSFPCPEQMTSWQNGMREKLAECLRAALAERH